MELPELPRRLAYFGPVRVRASISQIRAPPLLKVSRTQGKFAKSVLSPSQQISFLGTVMVTPEGALAIQQLMASFKLGFLRPLKAFQPHGLSTFGTLVGPASYTG